MRSVVTKPAVYAGFCDHDFFARLAATAELVD
jgi:hypothetical protein